MPGTLLPRARKRVIAAFAKLLLQPLENYVVRVPNDLAVLSQTLHKGDVILVEGDQRVSQVIRYLTQSCWSHCAIYVGDALIRDDSESAEALKAEHGEEAQHLLVEAIEGAGVTVSPLSKYLRYNIRICRPEGLSRSDTDTIINYVRSRIGHRYDLKHLLDLARYFFPVSVVPRRWRRAVLTLGRNSERAVICSTMLARGFAQIGYPILPQVSSAADESESPKLLRLLPRRWQRRRTYFRRRDPKLITPRDFDLSPYFQVVKVTHMGDGRFDYHDIVWEDETGLPEPVRATKVEAPETEVA